MTDHRSAPPASTLAATAATMRSSLRRDLFLMAGLCTAIALLLTVLFGRPLAKFVYAFAVGLSCWTVIDGGRLLVAWGLDRVRHWRGLRALPGLPSSKLGWPTMTPILLFGMLLGPALGLAIGDRLLGHESPSLLQLDSLATRLTLALSLGATLLTTLAIATFERLASARASAEAARREATESQLRLLQSQLEPHMLFNTLANLRVLIALDPPRAQAMLDRLIAFLRATLGASRATEHALGAEFDRVADYLALMAVRLGPRLQVRLDLPEALRAWPVPPLLLQPLVENSIQHGLEPKVDGGRIEVHAERQGSGLRLWVRDTGVGLGAATGGGSHFGLQQVRERLHTLYGERARFTLADAADAEGGAVATLELPAPG